MKTQTLLKIFAGVVTGMCTYLFFDSKEKKEKITELEDSLEEKNEILVNQQKSIDPILKRISQIQKPSFEPNDLSHIGQAKVLNEAAHAYGMGLYRSSAIMSGSVVESILQEELEQKLSFYQLIQKAKEHGFINEKEVHALNMVRKERNNVHDLKHEISQLDALNISIGLSEKFVESNKQKLLV